MSIAPITIGQFRIGPFLGMLNTGIPIIDQSAALPDENDSSILAQQQNVLNLKGQWPPSAEVRSHLEELIKTVEHVEAEMGISFNRNIVLFGGSPGYVGVTQDYNIHIDASIAAKQAPLSMHEIEGVLIHEAAHIRNNDLAHLTAMKKIDVLLQLGNLSEFYHNEPEKFAYLATQEFGGLEQFKTSLISLNKCLDESLGLLEKHAEYDSMTDRKMLGLLYKDSKFSDAILQLELSDEGFDHWMALMRAFQHQSQKEQAIYQQQHEAIGANFAESKSLLGIKEVPHHFSLDAAAKEQLDIIDTELLAPSAQRLKKWMDFMGCYSRAAEYKADDAVIAHATHPQSYAQSLEKIIHYANNAPNPFSEHPALPQAEDTSHPDLALRTDRSKKLLKCVDTMGKTCHIINWDAAIAMVNQEMGFAQKNASPNNNLHAH